jgi:hypothetical protein
MNPKDSRWKVTASVSKAFDPWKVTAALSEFGPNRELALAYADAWPDKTLFAKSSQPIIVRAIQEHEPSINPDFPNKAALQKVWENVSDKVRDLRYRDRRWLKPGDLKMLVEIVPSYNEWDAKKVVTWLSKFPGILVQVARDSSPCLFITGKPETLKKMEAEAEQAVKADEHSIQPNNDLRLWWD